jgi:hypothetical protein
MCSLMAEGALVFGDDRGMITFTDSDLRPSLSGKVFSRSVNLIARSRQNPPLFVVVGRDEEGLCLIKTWIGTWVATPTTVIDVSAQLKVWTLLNTHGWVTQLRPIMSALVRDG